MLSDLNVLAHLINNFFFLRSDFIGITFHIKEVVLFLTSIFIGIILLFLMYIIGEKIRLHFFSFNLKRTLIPFISIALGYIVIGTGIALLGAFSLFYIPIIVAYIVFLACIALYSIFKLPQKLESINFLIQIYTSNFKKHKLIHLAFLGFVLIGFLRLIVPETNVDALWYHTDLPRLYERQHSLMIKPNYHFHLTPIPQLSEMYNTVIEFFDIENVSRVINFIFYVLIIFLLYFINSGKNIRHLGLYAILLFVTSPVVIRHTSSALSNFQWIFCWLLSVILLTQDKKSVKIIILAALLFGGVLATKLWTIAFLPLMIFYLLIRCQNKIYNLKLCLIFLFFSLVVSSIWYARAYILTGNPVYPAFSKDEWWYPRIPSLSTHLSLDYLKFRAGSVLNFSPLFFLGVVVFFYRRLYRKIILHKSTFFLFIILLSLEYLILPYYFGHYLLGWYVLLIIVFSIGIKTFIEFNKFSRYLFSATYFSLFLYYFLNTVLVLPYGLGWADKNKYLSRIISRNNSSYYDYDHKFSKWISNNDKIAVYGIWGFYYGDFNYIDVVDIFRNNGNSIESIVKSGFIKLLIKGGDIQWFCNTMKVKDCHKQNFELLGSSEFSHAPASQYLYNIKYQSK